SFYVAIDIAPINLASFLNLAGEHFSALNVTSPHKNTVIDFCGKLSSTAQKTQSVNLLVFDNDTITGDNLDVLGFKSLVSRNEIPLNDKNVVVVGSGGVARSVIHAISETSSPAAIYVASRDPDMTERKLEAYDYDYPVIPYHEMFRICDVVINCTPDSAERALPKPPASKDSAGVAIDLVYNPARTVFLKIMEDAGWRILNGEDMF
ncbi:shikimate 5-dehydrogenase, partial [mine drainage metagenome]